MTICARAPQRPEPNDNVPSRPMNQEFASLVSSIPGRPTRNHPAPLAAPNRGRVLSLPSTTPTQSWVQRDLEAAVDAAGIALHQGRLNDALKQFAVLVALAETATAAPPWRLPAWVGLVATLAAHDRWEAAAKLAREQFAALSTEELPEAFVNASAIAAQWLPEHGLSETVPSPRTIETRIRRPAQVGINQASLPHDPAADYAHALMTAIRFRLSRSAQSA